MTTHPQIRLKPRFFSEPPDFFVVVRRQRGAEIGVMSTALIKNSDYCCRPVALASTADEIGVGLPNYILQRAVLVAEDFGHRLQGEWDGTGARRGQTLTAVGPWANSGSVSERCRPRALHLVHFEAHSRVVAVGIALEAQRAGRARCDLLHD